MTASAPGKVFLTGEYVVLDGEPALVAAIDRRASARAIAGGRLGRPVPPPMSAEVAAAVAWAREFLRSRGMNGAGGEVEVEAAALYDGGGRKLGLGSSAAGAVAGAAEVLGEAGLSLADVEVRGALAHGVAAGHARAMGGGSGADVFAAVFGGTLVFRDGRHEPATLPPGLAFVVGWTGVEARTPLLVAAVRDLLRRDPGEYERATTQIREGARGAVDAVRGRSATAFLRAVDGTAEGMENLGRASGVTIVTPEHRRAIEGARRAGGAAKPSGAGGGDIAVGFIDTDRRGRLAEAFRDAGLAVLDLAIDEDGVGYSASSGTAVEDTP